MPYQIRRRAAPAAVLASCLTLSAFISAPVYAAEPVQQAPFDEVIVTSSRIETPLRQVGTSVAVISEEEIRARGNISLTDILRSMPSVSVTNSGGTGKTTTLRIRGEEGFRTVTLIDGLKVSDPSLTQVQPQLEHTLTNGIERVEILRGPQGFSYGADAGGVINISTRSGQQGLQSQIEAGGGSFATRQVSANIEGAAENGDFFVSGARHNSDGFNILTADNVLRDRDGYENTTFHGRGGFSIGETVRIDLVHRDVDAESGFDNCYDAATFSTVHDCDSRYEQQASRVAATINAGNGLSQQLAWSGTRTDREDFALGLPAYQSSGKLERLEYLGNLSRLENMDIVYGIDSEQEDNNGDTRRQTGYYVEYLSDFSSSYFFSVGLRHDRNDDFGSHTSYRVTAARLIALDQGELKLRGNYGTGFRAPSLYEGHYNSSDWANPPASLTDLSEETSRGFELALEYQSHAGLELEAVFFSQQIEDAIYFDLAAFSGYLQDIGTSESEGVELAASLPLSAHLSLQANYSWNETRLPNGEQRQRRPRDLANIGLRYHAPGDRLQLNAFWRSSSNAIDQVNEQIFDLPDYNSVDLTASYRFNDVLEFNARIENAGNARYEEVVGYRNAGRTAYIGVRATL